MGIMMMMMIILMMMMKIYIIYLYRPLVAPACLVTPYWYQGIFHWLCIHSSHPAHTLGKMIGKSEEKDRKLSPFSQNENISVFFSTFSHDFCQCNDHVGDTKSLFFHQGSFCIGRTVWVLGLSWCFYFKLEASAQAFSKLHIRLTSDVILISYSLGKIMGKFRGHFFTIFPEIFHFFSQNGQIIRPFWEKNGKMSGKIQKYPETFSRFFPLLISQYLPLAVHW